VIRVQHEDFDIGAEIARARDPGVMAHMALVYGRADDLYLRKGVGEFGPAAFQPNDQLGDGRHALGRLDLLRRDARLLLDPGEIEETHRL